MKNIFILLLFPLFVNAQKCKYSIDKTDEFTKATILEAKVMVYDKTYIDGVDIALIIKKINSNYYVGLDYNIVSRDIYIISTDCKLMLKLDNDTILSFLPTEVYGGHEGRGTAVTNIKPMYIASKEDIQILSEHAIVKIRLYFSDGYKEYELNKKIYAYTMNTAKCILYK